MNNILLVQNILQILLEIKEAQSSLIYEELISNGVSISLVTVKRVLSSMKKKKIIISKGKGRYLYYSISETGRLITEVNSLEYFRKDPDQRYGLSTFNFKIIENLLKNPFTPQEEKEIKMATRQYIKKQSHLSPILLKKELERLVIELSWKSSKIEGNTYSLLDTEKLIKENIEANGHSKEESIMILNHKKAFDYIWKNKDIFKIINKSNLSQVHQLLTQDLDIPKEFRNGPIGITGSIYKPLDNLYQIEDALINLFEVINKCKTPYHKALIALTGISYIQPFSDGNKRTSRLITNAILLANNYSPLSYRGVDEEEYRAAMLTFYELNSIVAIKKIFISQYISATELYSLTNNL